MLYKNGNFTGYRSNYATTEPTVRLTHRPTKLVPKDNKPSYMQTRMSGDEVEKLADQFIEELQDEASYEEIVKLKDMVHALKSREQDIDNRWEAAANVAGMSREDLLAANNIADKDIQLVGNITPNVPEALVVKYANTRHRDSYSDHYLNGTPIRNETRMHTRFEKNPLTGQNDVVPFIADGEDRALVTQFGLVGKDIDRSAVDNMDSDEFLGKRMLQLAGMQPIRNNDSDVYAVDLLDQKSGKKVDVEMLKKNQLRQNGTVGFQVYTEMAPDTLAGFKNVGYGKSLDIAKDMARELKPLLKSRMTEGSNLPMAVAELSREGRITNSDGRYGPLEGKLLKDEGRYLDGLVQPVVKDKDAALNLRTKAGKNDTRKLVMPLEGAYLSDANAAKHLLKDEVLGPEGFKQLSVRPMAGNGGSRPSAKVYLEVPVSNKALVTDLAALTPRVRQLFGKQ